jgi:hypothetical protein
VALVLAIEPDHRQATILKRIVKEKVHADAVIVESPDAALAAINAQVPDVLLLSALLSPRDEDELIAHLRTLDSADHIQTHTIPQLASTGAYQDDQGRKGRGLLGVFKRSKKEADVAVPGCDPELFAEEIVTFLHRAAERKAEGVAALQSRVDRLEYEVQHNSAARGSSFDTDAFTAGPAGRASGGDGASADAASASSWSSPFEWKRNAPAASTGGEPQQDAAAEPLVADAPAESIAAYDAPPQEPVAAYDATPAYESAPAYEPPPAYEPAPSYEPVVAEETHQAMRAEPVSASAMEAVRSTEPIDDVPFADAPAPFTRREPVAAPPRRVVRSSGSLAPAAVLRLTPLAMWARSEAFKDASSATTAAPSTATDELRSMIATLAVPPHVAGVSYGRGCRIRRVRVPGGKDRRIDETAGPVILSRKALEEQRSEAR